MPKRVLVDGVSGAFKVSKAGIDVETAGEADLLFNADSAKLNIVFRGRAQLFSTDARSGSRDVMYPGGKVFSQPPFAFLGWSTNGGPYAPAVGGIPNNGHLISSPPGLTQQCHLTLGKQWHYCYGTNSQQKFPTGTDYAYYFIIFTMIDRLRMRWSYQNSNENYTAAQRLQPGDMSFYYAVCDYTQSNPDPGI